MATATTPEPTCTEMQDGTGRPLRIMPADVDGEPGVAVDVVRTAPGKARRLVVTLYFTREQFFDLASAGLVALVEGGIQAHVKADKRS